MQGVAPLNEKAAQLMKEAAPRMRKVVAPMKTTTHKAADALKAMTEMTALLAASDPASMEGWKAVRTKKPLFASLTDALTRQEIPFSS